MKPEEKDLGREGRSLKPETERAFANRVLLIRPQSFYSNPETLGSNSFQGEQSSGVDLSLIHYEFDSLHERLEQLGIGVELFESLKEAETPDAVFPNNWFSTHSSGHLILYPMFAPSRRRERREDIIQALQRRHGPYQILDLSAYESRAWFLEGTGSLVLDRRSRTGFCSLSARSSEELVKIFEQETGYSIFCFESLTAEARPVYHTNVMMSVGDTHALVCLDSISQPSQRKRLLEKLEEIGKSPLLIGLDQMESFCGNVLLLENGDAEKVWMASETAYRAFSKSQIQKLESEADLQFVSIPWIERLGGGSLRCMMAEIFPCSESPSPF
ncbi:MAG: amidinotransferase [Bradymonadales bacterium]|nr:MAG: amidinotransferase [Bradymonadales bacterium]